MLKTEGFKPFPILNERRKDWTGKEIEDDEYFGKESGKFLVETEDLRLICELRDRCHDVSVVCEEGKILGNGKKIWIYYG